MHAEDYAQLKHKFKNPQSTILRENLLEKCLFLKLNQNEVKLGIKSKLSNQNQSALCKNNNIKIFCIHRRLRMPNI